MNRIYLDNAATTPVRAEAVEAMLPLLRGGYNASSLHAEGRAARAALDAARESVASVLGAAPREIVFTGSGSEADVLAVVGAARARAQHGKHVVITAIEHHAVTRAADVLERDGWEITRLAVDRSGRIDPAAFAEALTERTALASVMLANNEIGVVQPVAELARLARSRGVLFHTDAVQAAGWLPLAVDALGVDLLSLSGHKFHAPKGIGMLYVRRGTPLEPLVVGGGQEHGLRGGTEDVAAIAAFATALRLAESERSAAGPRVAALRDRLENAVVAAIPETLVNGAGAPRVPGICSLAFADVASDLLLMRLDLEGVAASSGSACAAGAAEPSHVVAALELPARYVKGVVRFSLGRFTTAPEIEEVIARFPSLMAPARQSVAV